MTQLHTHFVASRQPRQVIETLPRRASQPPSMREYREGYEEFFNLLPTLTADDPLLAVKADTSTLVMRELAKAIKSHGGSLLDAPPAGQFSREILAVQDPELPHEGAEILVAKWGAGFSSPVHGHAPGLLYEEVLSGRIMVHTYRHVRPGVVRPTRSDIAGPGLIVSKYSPPDDRGSRMGLVHNFTALAPSISLHFVPEHTRDGRDNRFKVEHFAGIDATLVRQIDGDAGRLLQVGDVALVRSDNVPEYGDHFIVVTGSPVLKPHGLRPQDVAIQAGPVASSVLDQFEPTGRTGLRLLKLDATATYLFYEFHGLRKEGNTIVFPQL